MGDIVDDSVVIPKPLPSAITSITLVAIGGRERKTHPIILWVMMCEIGPYLGEAECCRACSHGDDDTNTFVVYGSCCVKSARSLAGQHVVVLVAMAKLKSIATHLNAALHSS
uniref:Uncharacterized protein n=1 Tax=Tanacetum cinerariifolium TaxID=118510 RepID=A0A699HGV9_TANCI|nr:hypothetical protein [Tanacetum cinerariifolium]